MYVQYILWILKMALTTHPPPSYIIINAPSPSSSFSPINTTHPFIFIQIFPSPLISLSYHYNQLAPNNPPPYIFVHITIHSPSSFAPSIPLTTHHHIYHIFDGPPFPSSIRIFKLPTINPDLPSKPAKPLKSQTFF